PCYFIDAENDSRMRTNFKLINWRTSQQVPKNFDSLDHFFAQLFLDNLLHRVGNKFQIALIGDLEFDFVLDIRIQRPRVIVNELVENLFIGEYNDTAAVMNAGY